jgi:hypothetical protein
LGEVDDLHDAEYQGLTGGHERVHAGREDPEDESLDESVHGRQPPQFGFAATGWACATEAG